MSTWDDWFSVITDRLDRISGLLANVRDRLDRGINRQLWCACIVAASNGIGRVQSLTGSEEWRDQVTVLADKLYKDLK